MRRFPAILLLATATCAPSLFLCVPIRTSSLLKIGGIGLLGAGLAGGVAVYMHGKHQTASVQAPMMPTPSIPMMPLPKPPVVTAVNPTTSAPVAATTAAPPAAPPPVMPMIVWPTIPPLVPTMSQPTHAAPEPELEPGDEDLPKSVLREKQAERERQVAITKPADNLSTVATSASVTEKEDTSSIAPTDDSVSLLPPN